MPKLRNLHKLLDREIRAKNLRAMRERVRGAWWDFSGQRMPAPVFLIGCSRSGTTVSYETLAASDELISIGYELPQFWDGLWGPAHNGWESEAATADAARPAHRDAFFRFFYARVGKGRILDKTCINILRIPYLLELFPGAQFRTRTEACSKIKKLLSGAQADHVAASSMRARPRNRGSNQSRKGPMASGSRLSIRCRTSAIRSNRASSSTASLW